jgi:Cu(I)/Ag(I) efflux system membrane protein CusA/SilA
MALGAEPVTTTVEGRERYTVSIRYPRDYRSDPQAIATEVLIPMADGGTVPLGHGGDGCEPRRATSSFYGLWASCVGEFCWSP